MKIRLPEALKESIEAAAQKAGRTLNSEVVARLQRSFDLPSPVGEAMAEDLNHVQLKKDLGHRQHMLDMARQRFEASRLRHELLVGQYEFTRRTRDPEVSAYARQLRDKVAESKYELQLASANLEECEQAVLRLASVRTAGRLFDLQNERNSLALLISQAGPKHVPATEIKFFEERAQELDKLIEAAVNELQIIKRADRDQVVPSPAASENELPAGNPKTPNDRRRTPRKPPKS